MLHHFVLMAALTFGAVTPNAFARSYDGQELRCLALTIYWEARGESELGQRAVGHVVLNRAGHPDFPSTVCGVVAQGEDSAPRSCQFSWECDGRADTPTDRQAWEKAQEIARQVLVRPDDDPSNGALYFHTTAIKPPWRRTMQVVARIGEHIFYAPRDDRASTKSVQR